MNIYMYSLAMMKTHSIMSFDYLEVFIEWEWRCKGGLKYRETPGKMSSEHAQ